MTEPRDKPDSSEVHGTAPVCTCANRPQFGSPTGGKGIVGWDCAIHGPMQYRKDDLQERIQLSRSACPNDPDCDCVAAHCEAGLRNLLRREREAERARIDREIREYADELASAGRTDGHPAVFLRYAAVRIVMKSDDDWTPDA